MTRSELPRRLAVLSEMIPKCVCLADIGCDHGFLGAYALMRGLCTRLIASDRSASSLARSSWLSGSFGGQVSLRCGDGLSVLRPGEADAIVIAGMGGRQIMRIIESGYTQAERARAVLLLPHRNAPELRSYLLEHGFFIEQERIAEERGRFYSALRCMRGTQSVPYTAFEMEAGRLSLSGPDSSEARYLCAAAAKAERLACQLASSLPGNARIEALQEFCRTARVYRDEKLRTAAASRTPAREASATDTTIAGVARRNQEPRPIVDAMRDAHLRKQVPD